MKCTVNYYGMIAEHLKKEKDELKVGENTSLNDLRSQLLKDYPGLKDYSFQIAINNRIEAVETIIEENNEIAIMPPFAGG